MTTTTFSCAPDNTSDATFRAWVAAIVTAMDAVVTRTADTGQINAGTVTRPVAASTAAGYGIWRFNDTLQATRPLFIKLEFGTAANATPANGAPQVWFTLGKSADGAGNIGGVLVARQALTAAITSLLGDTGILTGYASAGDGWAALIPWAAFNPGAAAKIPLAWFTIERTHGGDGVAVALPYQVVSAATYGNLATTSQFSSVPRLLAVVYATAATNWGSVPVTVPCTVNGSTLGNSTALAASAVGPVFPWVALTPGLAPYQCVDAISYPGGDTPGAAFTAPINGVTRTYLPIPISDNHNAFGLAVRPADTASQTAAMSRYVGLAIRWE